MMQGEQRRPQFDRDTYRILAKVANKMQSLTSAPLLSSGGRQDNTAIRNP
jgi:hypothetical protein